MQRTCLNSPQQICSFAMMYMGNEIMTAIKSGVQISLKLSASLLYLLNGFTPVTHFQPTGNQEPNVKGE